MENSLVTRRYFITGSQRVSNFFLASLISFGGIAFLITGFISFLNRGTAFGPLESLPFSNIETGSLTTTSIKFFPQGLIMCFYGALGLVFGMYLWLTILWKVGSGFNEFNKNTGVVRIFRWGLPGKNRQIDLKYKIKEIEALRVSLKEGINPRRSLSLQIKGKGEIPLTRIGQPIPLQEIENQASELAQFLKVEIEVEN